MSLISTIFTFILNLLDYLLYFVLVTVKGKKVLPRDMQGIGKKRSAMMSNEHKDDETASIRNPNYLNKELATTPVQGIDTVSDLFSYVVKEHGKKRFMGSRALLDIETTIKKVNDTEQKLFTYVLEPQMTWQTFEEIDKRVQHLALGIMEFTGLKAGDRFAIFENTSQEWMMLAWALMRCNITVVTVYATLGDDALVAALTETEITSVFTNETNMAKFGKLSKQIPTLSKLIYAFEKKTSDGAALKQLQEQAPSIKVLSFAEIEALGKQSKSDLVVSPKATRDSLAMIMYTSGTTGHCKGVMITHGNILSTVAGVGDGLDFDPEQPYIYLAYLPLAHILEFCAENYIMFKGGCIAYGNPRTLTDRTAKPCGDLSCVKPTVLAGVPRIYDTIKKGILDLVNDHKLTSSLKRWMFNTAFAAKKAALYEQRDTPLWNLLVFNKVRANIGGRVQIMISGAAPLSKETQEFLRVVFGAQICQGYALTETTAGATVQSQTDVFSTTRVGGPVCCAELKLVSVPDMNYSVKSNPPKGEICVRGPCITKGYFKQESKTKEDFKSDGWFHTGDVGQLNDDGTFSIIDRKKNLVKLSHGEYVAVEKLESIYACSPFVSPNGICVYGDGFHNTLVALVLPQQKHLFQWAAENNIPNSDNLKSLVGNPQVIKAVLDSLHVEFKKANLGPIEKISDVTLLTDEWTPENVLTASMKLKRNVVAEKYKAEIKKMFKE